MGVYLENTPYYFHVLLCPRGAWRLSYKYVVVFSSIVLLRRGIAVYLKKMPPYFYLLLCSEGAGGIIRIR